MEKKFYKVTEIANILGVSKSFIYAEASRGTIPCVKLGRRVLIPAAYIVDIIQNVKEA